MLCHGMSQSPEDWEKDWPEVSRNNDKLDEFKKATIALRYIGLIRGKNNVEDKYTKQLSDLNFENSFGFKWITKLN